MKMKTPFCCATGASSLLLLFFLVSASARGALTVTESETDEGRLTTFQMTVTPAAEPVPALKHRLMLREIELQPGNAAPYYYRALMGVRQTTKAMADQYGEDYDKWYSRDIPLDELPLEKVRKAVRAWSGSMMTNLRTAAGRRYCDWQWNLEEIRGVDLIAFLLEEVQESRSLARALMLQTRLALAEGRTEDAIDLLRLNYRLARDVAEEPLLVCDLVGIALASMGNAEVIELIAQPNSPSLYWALTELPRPLVDLRDSLRMEMSFGLRMFPFLPDAETTEHSSEEWSRLFAEALNEGQSLGGGIGGFNNDHVPAARIAVAGASLLAYPAAKQRLIDGGMDRKRVEEMPAGQVLAIDASREYRRIADEYEKWQYVPYRLVRQRDPEEPFHHRGGPQALVKGGFGYTLAALLLPAVQAARTAEQRLLWQTDGIRTVEAIRMHASQTGHLPKSLDEIQVVPVPENPATGKPFEYKLDGKTAILDMPHSDGFPGIAWRFEIKLAESSK